MNIISFAQHFVICSAHPGSAFFHILSLTLLSIFIICSAFFPFLHGFWVHFFAQLLINLVLLSSQGSNHAPKYSLLSLILISSAFWHLFSPTLLSLTLQSSIYHLHSILFVCSSIRGCYLLRMSGCKLHCFSLNHHLSFAQQKKPKNKTPHLYKAERIFCSAWICSAWICSAYLLSVYSYAQLMKAFLFLAKKF